jgi:hypothetical protein
MEQTSARAWRGERPSGSNPLRLLLDQTHPGARHVDIRGQPGVQQFLRRTLYTVFSCSSRRLGLLSRLLIELREERTPSDRLFLWVAEIELHRCREECSYLFSRRKVSSGCFKESERWVIGANVVPCHVSCQSRFRRPVRLRTTAVARIQPTMMKITLHTCAASCAIQASRTWRLMTGSRRSRV